MDELVDFNEPASPQDDNIKALIAELRSLAFSDIGGMYDENNCLLDIKNIPESLRRAIASIETDETYIGTGSAREKVGETKRVKLWAKDQSIEKFMKHLGMFIEKMEVKTSMNVSIKLIDEYKELPTDRLIERLLGRN